MPHPSRIAAIPGDGIGPEVIAEVLDLLRALGGLDIEILPWSAEHYLATGETVPPGGYEYLRGFDAVLAGAFGDPRVPDNRHARDILLGTRFELDLYVNYRPVRLLDERLCPLRGRGPGEVQIDVLRENTEGLYVNIGGRFKPGTADEVTIQEEINTYKGVRRILAYAFEHARGVGRPRLCMADKSNAMAQGHALWQRVFHELAPQYPEVDATHLYIDALVLFLVQDPGRFDVIVTNNLFGDIVTDLGAALQGGLGVAASANLHPGRTSLFEPVHGSAPPLAGKGVANPIGAMLSAALMLETLGRREEARRIERAVQGCVRDGTVTRDLGGTLSTHEAGEAIRARALADT